MLWKQFIQQKIKGVQGVSHFSVKNLKSTEEFLFYPFLYDASTLTVRLMMLE